MISGFCPTLFWQSFFSYFQICLALLVSGSLAAPQGQYGAPKCEKKRVAQPISYDCQQDQECKTSYEEQCQTKYEQECQTKYEEKCELEYEDKCETKYEEQCEVEYAEQCETKYEQQCQTEYDQQCETKYEQKCETGYETKCRTEYDEQCETKYEQQCETKYETQYEVSHFFIMFENSDKILTFVSLRADVNFETFDDAFSLFENSYKFLPILFIL